MDQEISLPCKREYNINIENMNFYMLVGMHSEPNISEVVNNLATQTPHSHSFAELFYCSEGEIIINTEFEEINLSAGDIAIIPVGIKHIKLPSDKTVIWNSFGFFCVQRHQRNCQDWYRLYNSICHSPVPLILRKNAEICREISIISQDEQTLFPGRQALQMAELLLRLFCANPDSLPLRSGPSGTNGIDLYRISQLEHLLETSFMKEISSAEAADMLYISKRQFERIVSKRYNMTWREIMLERKLSMAAKMLTETDLSIEKISEQVGLKSQTSLYSMFRKKYGMTPSQFRRSHQNRQEERS